MSIEPFQQLAVKLTRISVIAALLLGLAASLWQVKDDFEQHREMNQKSIEEIFAASRQSAQQTVHQLDRVFAEQIISGLMSYPFLQSAALVDDRDNTMAGFERELHRTNTSQLTQALVGSVTTYTLDLVNEDNYSEGKLILITDNNYSYQSFYRRAGSVLLTGIARNLALTFVLMGFFYWYLTRSLVRVAQSVFDIDANHPEGKRITVPPQHKKDELGLIIRSMNEFIGNCEKHLLSSDQAKEQLNVIIDTVPNLIFATDDKGRFLFANRAAQTLFDIKANDIDQLSYYDVLSRHQPREARRIQSQCQTLLNGEHLLASTETMELDPNTGSEHFQTSRLPFSYFGKRCILHVAVNITERVTAEQQMREMAYYDTLTGLPNRNYLVDQLKKDITSALDEGYHGALLFIDMDNFKLVNDSAGHMLGDRVIAQIGRLIQFATPQNDTIARLGGDEFALSLSNLGNNNQAARQQAVLVADRILNTLDRNYYIGRQHFSMSSSIGIVLYPDHSDEVDELLRYADTAMYQAKSMGKNKSCVFEMSMISAVEEQVALEYEIKRGFSQEEFEIYLQPIVDAAGNIVSAEVLIRWNHPEKGVQSPVSFMKQTEMLNLSDRITSICFSQCCELALNVGIEYLRAQRFRFAVNVNPQEFHEGSFEENIFNTLQKYGVPSDLFEIEITESVALYDVKVAETKIHRLRKHGITISLDDFGTGYSSLSYLKRLAIDKLKIDRSFIQEIETDRQDKLLVESIVEIARNFGLIVVAEGIENENQAQWLSRFSEIRMQGFHFHRPLPRNRFLALLKSPDGQATSHS